MEEVYSKLLDRVTELNRDTNMTDTLTPTQLNSLTGEPLDDKYVEDNNTYLTLMYKELVSAFGCDDFKSLYNKAKENAVRKGKDFSSLNLTQRVVTRNGKQMRTSIYEKPVAGGVDNKIKLKQEPDSHAELDVKMSKELIPFKVSDTYEQLSDTDKKLIEETIKKDFSVMIGDTRSLTYVIVLVDDSGIMRSIMGFDRNQYKNLEYRLFASDNETLQLDTRFFFEGVRVALQTESNIEVPYYFHDLIDSSLLKFYGFSKEQDSEGSLIIGYYDDLVKHFGEWTWGKDDEESNEE